MLLKIFKITTVEMQARCRCRTTPVEYPCRTEDAAPAVVSVISINSSVVFAESQRLVFPTDSLQQHHRQTGGVGQEPRLNPTGRLV